MVIIIMMIYYYNNKTKLLNTPTPANMMILYATRCRQLITVNYKIRKYLHQQSAGCNDNIFYSNILINRIHIGIYISVVVCQE